MSHPMIVSMSNSRKSSLAKSKPKTAEQLDSPPELPNSIEPIAVFPAFIANHPETLIIEEGVLKARDPFSVRTAEGREVLRVHGRRMSSHRWKMVSDINGKHLFDIERRYVKKPTCFKARNHNHTLFEIFGKWSISTFKAIAKFDNAMRPGEKVSLYMHGSPYNPNFTIKNERNNKVVAIAQRKFIDMRQIKAGRQTYEVKIAPGIDMALIASMIVCLGNRRDIKRNKMKHKDKRMPGVKPAKDLANDAVPE